MIDANFWYKFDCGVVIFMTMDSIWVTCCRLRSFCD